MSPPSLFDAKEGLTIGRYTTYVCIVLKRISFHLLFSGLANQQRTSLKAMQSSSSQSSAQPNSMDLNSFDPLLSLNSPTMVSTSVNEKTSSPASGGGGMVGNGTAPPPSPPWEDDDVLMNCMEDVHSFVDDILLSGNSPDSLRYNCHCQISLTIFLPPTDFKFKCNKRI